MWSKFGLIHFEEISDHRQWNAKLVRETRDTTTIADQGPIRLTSRSAHCAAAQRPLMNEADDREPAHPTAPAAAQSPVPEFNLVAIPKA